MADALVDNLSCGRVALGWRGGTDEAGIRRTIAAYPELVDDGRFEEVGRLYAPDGLLAPRAGPGRDRRLSRRPPSMR
ncbi:MAG: nuclear transport factor 2 family protein [Actinomycetota bacterium]